MAITLIDSADTLKMGLLQDWAITLINSADTLKELTRKELHWMYKLKTYAPYRLNERNVYEAF